MQLVHGNTEQLFVCDFQAVSSSRPNELVHCTDSHPIAVEECAKEHARGLGGRALRIVQHLDVGVRSHTLAVVYDAVQFVIVVVFAGYVNNYRKQS